jgi:hypothetical protein
MSQSVTQLGGIWDWLTGPSYSEDERRAMLNQFPALQRRNRELHAQWDDLMNRLEAGERFGNSRTPELLSQMADLIVLCERNETTLYNQIRSAVDDAVRRGTLPASVKREAGLEALPIIVMFAIIAAVLIGVLGTNWYATFRLTQESQARAYAIKLAAERGDPLPPDTPGPVERTATSLGFVAILVGGALWFFTQGRRRP